MRVVVILAVAILVAHASQARAELIDIDGNSPEQVKKKCDAAGGTNLPLNESGTYGCVNQNGSGVICGGKDPIDQGTCDTFRKVPPGGVRNRAVFRPKSTKVKRSPFQY